VYRVATRAWKLVRRNLPDDSFVIATGAANDGMPARANIYRYRAPRELEPLAVLRRELAELNWGQGQDRVILRRAEPEVDAR
jgi:hypothetical protein